MTMFGGRNSRTKYAVDQFLWGTSKWKQSITVGPAFTKPPQGGGFPRGGLNVKNGPFFIASLLLVFSPFYPTGSGYVPTTLSQEEIEELAQRKQEQQALVANTLAQAPIRAAADQARNAAAQVALQQQQQQAIAAQQQQEAQAAAKAKALADPNAQVCNLQTCKPLKQVQEEQRAAEWAAAIAAQQKADEVELANMKAKASPGSECVLHVGCKNPQQLKVEGNTVASWYQ